MTAISAFSTRQQFHLLIDYQGTECAVTVLPGADRLFLVIGQGNILGERNYDERFNCIAHAGFDPDEACQLSDGIKSQGQQLHSINSLINSVRHL
jgi:hypothetical protein